MIDKEELKRVLNLMIGKKCVNCKCGFYVTKFLMCDNCGVIFNINKK